MSGWTNTSTVGIARQPDRSEHRPDLPHAARTLREESAHGEDHEELAELGRLESQGADAEPPLRAACFRPERDHEEQQQEADRVELAPVAPVDRSGSRSETPTIATPPTAA